MLTTENPLPSRMHRSTDVDRYVSDAKTIRLSSCWATNLRTAIEARQCFSSSSNSRCNSSCARSRGKRRFSPTSSYISPRVTSRLPRAAARFRACFSEDIRTSRNAPRSTPDKRPSSIHQNRWSGVRTGRRKTVSNTSSEITCADAAALRMDVAAMLFARTTPVPGRLPTACINISRDRSREYCLCVRTAIALRVQFV